MSRVVKDRRLDTREARSRLKAQGKPYWRLIEPGLHLGYRRLRGRPGTWSVRRYVGAQSYEVERLRGVVADDYSEADGQTVLDFAQAQQQALAKKPKAGPLTVQGVVEDYLRHIEHKSGTYDAGRRAQAFIFPALGDLKVEELTTARLRQWHADMADAPRRCRTREGEQQQYLKPDQSEEGRRRRRSSANRVLTTLKAALNHAWREGRVASDAEWKRVKPFPGTVRARVRYLIIEECRRLVNASDGDFRLLVQAALATGCRYSELARLGASDFNATAGTVHVRLSKSGKPRHVVLTNEGIALFQWLCAGRTADELLFRAPGGGPWTRSCQDRPMQLACERARIRPPASFHILRHTWASLSVMAGMPLMVVARNLGHASTKMVEQHYGHLAPSYIAEQVRENAPRFGFKSDKKIAALHG